MLSELVTHFMSRAATSILNRLEEPSDINIDLLTREDQCAVQIQPLEKLIRNDKDFQVPECDRLVE